MKYVIYNKETKLFYRRTKKERLAVEDINDATTFETLRGARSVVSVKSQYRNLNYIPSKYFFVKIELVPKQPCPVELVPKRRI